MLLLLIVILLIVGVGGLPQTGWHSMGYGLSGGVGLVLVILVVLLLVGRV